LEISRSSTDPVKDTLSLNLHRRHLSESQRAMIAAKLANLEPGERKSNTPIGVSQAEAAEQLKVSRSSVQAAVFAARREQPARVFGMKTALPDIPSKHWRKLRRLPPSCPGSERQFLRLRPNLGFGQTAKIDDAMRG